MNGKVINAAMEGAVARMNRWGARGKPFLFIIDFEMKRPRVISMDEAFDPDASLLCFDIRGFTNAPGMEYTSDKPLYFDKHPVSEEDYRMAFDKVMTELNYGNTYLLNLTFGSLVRVNWSLEQIFYKSNAPYKLYWPDYAVVFSPECFIRIRDGIISAFPMKGTIDASIPDAAGVLLTDPKELAEHTTIVDLIRNDLSRVATDVTVRRFRFLDTVRTHQKTLLQMSSEISGTLRKGYRRHLGDILYTLLPAGSVSGAPKKKTLEIIREVEWGPRDLFTGVFGYFNGKELDSGVMIRYIYADNGALIYRSGGGITARSDWRTEYQELIDKIYVPVY